MTPAVDADPPQPATRPAERVIDLPTLVAAVPAEVLPPEGAGWTVAKADIANQSLSQAAAGPTAVRFTVQVTDVTASEQSDSQYKVTGTITDPAKPSAFETHVVVYCTTAEADFAARLNVGRPATFVASLTDAQFVLSDPLTDSNGNHLPGRTALLRLTTSRPRGVK